MREGRFCVRTPLALQRCAKTPALIICLVINRCINSGNPSAVPVNILRGRVKKSYNVLQPILLVKEGENSMSEQTINIIIGILLFVVLGFVKNRFGMG